MNGNCHFIFGISVGTAIAINLTPISTYLSNVPATQEDVTLLIMGGIIGGIFPDIDNPKSSFGKLSAPFSIWIGKINKLFGKIGPNHRGILHDPIIYLIGLILSCCYFPSLCGFFIGCISHIFLDMFNPKGVPFLFGTKKLHLGAIASGDKQCIIFTRLMAILVLFLGIASRLGLASF